MDRKSFDMLTLVVDAFRHVGWVNGLRPAQYDVLNEANEYIRQVQAAENLQSEQTKLAVSLREQGYTIREIAAVLGYKHPGSVSHLLNKAL